MSATSCLLGFRVRIPLGAWISVFCECCVMSGRGLYVGLVTRPEESYRVCLCSWSPLGAVAPWEVGGNWRISFWRNECSRELTRFFPYAMCSREAVDRYKCGLFIDFFLILPWLRVCHNRFLPNPYLRKLLKSFHLVWTYVDPASLNALIIQVTVRPCWMWRRIDWRLRNTACFLLRR